MPTPQELEQKLWDALRSDRTVMLGLQDSNDGLRPMTVQADSEDQDRGPLWIFTANDNGIVEQLAGSKPGIAAFASKDHEIFAMIEGTLSVDNDRAVIDRLWNPFVAAWYEDGKDDPKLVLLRFDTTEAEIWENANSLFSGLKMLLGADPKQDYKDKTADVRMT